jgi:hypothetical protein
VDSEKALFRFLVAKAEIDEHLRRLTELSGNHFEVTPEDIGWGHVGSLQEVANLLKEIVDNYAS